MNSKLAIAVATSTLLLGSAAVAQTTPPNVSGDPSTTMVVTPAVAPTAPTSTQRTVSSPDGTTTTTTVTVTPKAAPVAAPTTGAGEAVAGERG
jgi:hypothetical protein